MLNFILKTRQNRCAVNTREWATVRKVSTLTTASVSGCRTSCPQIAGTASWKRRRNLPLTSGFQFVEITLNNFRPITFWDIASFCHRQMGQNFRFHRFFVCHFVHDWGAYLGFTAQRHKLRSICRNTKSQDDDLNVFWCLWLCISLQLALRLAAMAVCFGANSTPFCANSTLMRHLIGLPPFTYQALFRIKTSLRENRFFAVEWVFGGWLGHL